ncbi:hypothetical protein E1B28_012620 [Marasmius oreades]|uniref:Uncharacterized protein n=1 Tax=Marasmius oreades TaxID=181124 RepID=A0A9P7RT85_9AGAR|nr:uncharacterized protein E1B28_012620 [Marasmius oreades]KAG7088648.1 hypothetical protein E1B28_012620 [Marasmius oreades]
MPKKTQEEVSSSGRVKKQTKQTKKGVKAQKEDELVMDVDDDVNDDDNFDLPLLSDLYHDTPLLNADEAASIVQNSPPQPLQHKAVAPQAATSTEYADWNTSENPILQLPGDAGGSSSGSELSRPLDATFLSAPPFPPFPSSTTIMAVETTAPVQQQQKRKERDAPDPSTIIEGSTKRRCKPSSKVVESKVFSAKKPAIDRG